MLNGKSNFIAALKGKGYEHKGEFDATAIYQNTNQIIDCVLYNGTSYYCKKTTTAGIAPTNTEYWGVMATSAIDPNIINFAESEMQKSEGEDGAILHTGDIDKTLSTTSENVVQNKVIANEFKKIGEWKDCGFVEIANTRTTTQTNVDISSFIENYDENGEYEVNLVFSIYASSNTECFVGSDLQSIGKITEGGSPAPGYQRFSFLIPVKRYLKYRLSQISLNGFVILLLSYRRSK